MKLSLLALFLFSQVALAANKVTLFVSLSPAGSFEAVSEKLKGNIIKQGGGVVAEKLWVSIESFKTGNELRDEHFWKHLNSSKHTKATLTGVKGQAGQATGTLEVNGIKKPVDIAYAEQGSDIKAKFKVKASDYALPAAKYLGVGVNDEIMVEAIYPFVGQ